MGREYRLSGQNFNQEMALQFVQRRFVVVQHHNAILGLCLPAPDGSPALLASALAWPPVFVAVEAEGFYYCDNLNSPFESAAIFKQLTEFLLSTNEEIQVAEL